MTKEDIYDSMISPLMEQVIDACQAHKIAMVATFHIPNADDPDLLYTAALVTKEYEPHEKLRELVRCLYERPQVLALTITTDAPRTTGEATK